MVMIASSDAAETIVHCRLTLQNPAATKVRLYKGVWIVVATCRPGHRNAVLTIYETNNNFSKTMHQKGILTLPGTHGQCWRIRDDEHRRAEEVRAWTGADSASKKNRHEGIEIFRREL